MATQFDFYDGGGLDICFMGGLEVDRHGNVNAHKVKGLFVGIGGFINITAATKNIVFCISLTTKGLIAKKRDDKTVILREGTVTKYKNNIGAISFSAKDALSKGQNVLYVTERCVFELTPGGLRLKEVYDGIDAERDILPLLDFTLV
jgi:propionate CoA-transferase